MGHGFLQRNSNDAVRMPNRFDSPPVSQWSVRGHWASCNVQLATLDRTWGCPFRAPSAANSYTGYRCVHVKTVWGIIVNCTRCQLPLIVTHYQHLIARILQNWQKIIYCERELALPVSALSWITFALKWSSLSEVRSSWIFLHVHESAFLLWKGALSALKSASFYVLLAVQLDL